MNLHNFFGDEIYLFHQAQPYQNYLLCPTQIKGCSGFKATVFHPSGEPVYATQDDPVYATPEEALAAARRSVDVDCTIKKMN